MATVEELSTYYRNNRCSVPNGGKGLSFLQTSGHDDADTAAGSPSSDDNLLKGANGKSLNYDPAGFWSYHSGAAEEMCDRPDGDKCPPVNPEKAPQWDKTLTVFNKLFADLSENLDDLGTELAPYAGEQMVKDVATTYMKNVKAKADSTEQLRVTGKAVMTKSNEGASSAHIALHNAVRAMRAFWAERFTSYHYGGGDEMTEFQNMSSVDTESDKARYTDAQKALDEALGHEDAAITAHDKAREAWDLKDLVTLAKTMTVPATLKVDPGPMPTAKQPEEKKEPETPADPPIVTDPGGPGTTTTPPDDSKDDDLKDLLDKLVNSDPVGETPSSGVPDLGSGGMPDMSSGGMPDMGGLGDGLTPLSDAMTEPMGPEDKPEDDEKPEDDDLPVDEPPVGDEEALDPALADDVPPGDGELGPDGEPVDGEGKPEDGENPADGVTPVVEGEPPAGAPVDTETARTVDVGNGRMVTFPTERLAAMGSEIVRAAGEGNPTDLYMASAKADMELPPMGQEIGRPIGPSQLQEGDAVISPAGKGLYVGGSDVLCEDGSVKKLDELASTFTGQGDGFYRIDPDADPKTGADAPSQPLSQEPQAPTVSGDSTVNASAAAPGVPTNDAPPAPAGDGTGVTTGSGTTENDQTLSPLDIFTE